MRGRWIDSRAFASLPTAPPASATPAAADPAAISLQLNFAASARVLTDDADCVVMSIAWPSFDGFEFKYVDNKIGHVGEHSLADYDDFIIIQTEKEAFPLPLYARRSPPCTSRRV